MQILKPHFKNYRKEIILAIITILISAFATLWQPRLLENIQKAILADNQSVVLRDGIGLVVLGLLAIIAGIFNVYYAEMTTYIEPALREKGYSLQHTSAFIFIINQKNSHIQMIPNIKKCTAEAVQ